MRPLFYKQSCIISWYYQLDDLPTACVIRIPLRSILITIPPSREDSASQNITIARIGVFSEILFPR